MQRYSMPAKEMCERGWGEENKVRRVVDEEKSEMQVSVRTPARIDVVALG